jgi:hypothetical protein
MKNEQRARLAQIWAILAGYYRVKLDDAVLRMYSEDLSDLDFDAVQTAMNDYRKNPKNKFMPMPAQIRELLEPQVDPDSAAREIAARITAAIPKFGWCNGQDARAYIGEVGWLVVERQGGWAYICEHHGRNLDPGQFQAQVRELAKSTLVHDQGAMNERVNRLPSSTRPELSSASEIITTAFKRITGEGA